MFKIKTFNIKGSKIKIIIHAPIIITISNRITIIMKIKILIEIMARMVLGTEIISLKTRIVIIIKMAVILQFKRLTFKKRGEPGCAIGQRSRRLSSGLSPNIFTLKESNCQPIISIRISDTNQNSLKALVDSGADVCVIKLSVLNHNAIINTQNARSLNSFSNDKISTLGTFKAIVYLKDKEYEQIFHVTPNSVRMNDTQVILGKDFLNKYGIIMDFGKGFLYSNPENIEITIKQSPNSVLKKKAVETPQTKDNKTIKASSSNDQHSNTILSKNIYDCLKVEDEDILYADNIALKTITDTFNSKTINEVNSKGYEIVLGCSKGQIFCMNDKPNKTVTVITINKQRNKNEISMSRKKVSKKENEMDLNSELRLESNNHKSEKVPSQIVDRNKSVLRVTFALSNEQFKPNSNCGNEIEFMQNAYSENYSENLNFNCSEPYEYDYYD